MNDRYTQEKNKFQKILKNIVNNKYPKPKIFIVNAADEEGKNNLLQSLKNISTENSFKDKFNILHLDWNDKRNPNINIESDKLLKIIYQEFLATIYKFFIDKNENWFNYFDTYISRIKECKETEERIKKALKEYKHEDTNSLDLKTLDFDGILEFLRMSKSNSTEEEFDEVYKFVKSCLESEDDIEFIKNPEDILAKNLGTGIRSLAEKEKPLIIFFDNYEINYEKEDEIKRDDILRKAIKNSGGNVVWVIAGKTNLFSSGLKNPKSNEALLGIFNKENEEPDVIAIAIRLLKKFDNTVAVEQLVKFLDFEHDGQDRFVREAAVRELGNLVKFKPYQEIILRKAVDEIIYLFRYDYMSQVRNAAKEALEKIAKETGSLKDYQKEREKVKLTLELDQTEQQEQEEDKCPEKDETKTPDKLFKLLEGLFGNSKEKKIIRKKVAELIRNIGKKIDSYQDIIDALISALDFNDKNDRFVRKAAAIALTELTPTEEIINALNEAARKDVISDVRDAAKKSLEDIRDKDGNSPEMKEKAKTYLELINRERRGQLKGDNVDEIINILSSTDIDEKIKAPQTLRNYYNTQNCDSIVDALINTLLNDNEPDVCAAAADTLGEIKNSHGLEPLLKKINDKDRIVRQAAIEAIGKLKATPEQLNEQQVVEILIDTWRNDPIRDVRDAVEWSMRQIYKINRHPNARKALERYPNYYNKEKQCKYNYLTIEKYYKQFFEKYP